MGLAAHETQAVARAHPAARATPFLAAGLVFLALLAARYAQTRGASPSWNEASRMAAIESMVERGTWRIDASPFLVTGDKLLLDGHYYSDKPPLLAALGTVPYAAFRHLLGWRLDLHTCTPDRPCTRRWLTWTMVGVPSAALVAAFFLAAYAARASWAAALAGAALLAFGTMVWPFSLVLLNHVPAAACLFGSFALLVAARGGGRILPARLAGAGLLAGLAVSFDLPALFMAAALVPAVFLRHGARGLVFLAGAAVPAAATIALDYAIAGTLLPPSFRAEGWNWPGSPFPATVSGLKPPPDPLPYAFEGLLGARGLLTHCPLLLVGAAGLVRVLRDGRHGLRPEAWAVAAGSLAFAVFIFTRTDSYGGKAYAQRYFVVLVPLLAYFALFALPRSLRGWRGGVAAAAVAAAAVLSVASARKGARVVWAITAPPVYLAQTEQAPYVTVCRAGKKRPCFDWRGWRRRWRRWQRAGAATADFGVTIRMDGRRRMADLVGHDHGCHGG